jgi:G3E family GTPase
MRLLIVSGMLGSGKTSVILRVAETLSDNGSMVAIIENEIGSVGVDGEILERSGLKVRELKGGCICCTMKTGMIDTLRTLQAVVNPDIAIIEPTGIADPHQVIDAVDGVTGLSVTSIFTIIVVDAERFLKIKKMFERPLKNQVSVANLVLINKTDTVSNEEADAIEEHIRSLLYEGPIIRVQADKGVNMERVTEYDI